MLADEFVDELKRPPVPPELARRKPADGGVPGSPGLYAWWSECDAIGELPLTVVTESALKLLYIGSSPTRRDSRQTLRTRICGRDLRGGPAESPLRRTLCALLWQRQQWKLTHSGSRIALTQATENALNEWQASHLQVSWVICPDPWVEQPLVVKALQPAINLAENRAHPYSWLLSEARQRLRSAALAG